MGPLAHQTTGPLISWSVGPWVHWSVAHWVLRCRIAKFSNFLSFADSLQTEGISCQNICAYVTVHIGLKKNLQTSFLGSRVLPCFLSLQFTIMQSRATGIADLFLALFLTFRRRSRLVGVVRRGWISVGLFLDPLLELGSNGQSKLFVIRFACCARVESRQPASARQYDKKNLVDIVYVKFAWKNTFLFSTKNTKLIRLREI